MSKEEEFPTHVINILYFANHAAERFVERFIRRVDSRERIGIENYIQYFKDLLDNLRGKTYVCSLLGKYNKVQSNEILTEYDICFSVTINEWKVGLAGFYYPSHTTICITTTTYVLKNRNKQNYNNNDNNKHKKEKSKIGNITICFSENLEIISGCPKYPFTQNKESFKKRNYEYRYKIKKPGLESILARSTLLGAVLKLKRK